MWEGQQIIYHDTLIRKLRVYNIGTIFLRKLHLTVIAI